VQRDEPGFMAFMETILRWPDFFRVCETLAELRFDRPFIPRAIKGMTRASHALALGLGGASGLSARL